MRIVQIFQTQILFRDVKESSTYLKKKKKALIHIDLLTWYLILYQAGIEWVPLNDTKPSRKGWLCMTDFCSLSVMSILQYTKIIYLVLA